MLHESGPANPLFRLWHVYWNTETVLIHMAKVHLSTCVTAPGQTSEYAKGFPVVATAVCVQSPFVLHHDPKALEQDTGIFLRVDVRFSGHRCESPVRNDRYAGRAISLIYVNM